MNYLQWLEIGQLDNAKSSKQMAGANKWHLTVRIGCARPDFIAPFTHLPPKLKA